MPDHPPTQPAPMSEDELKAIESLSNSFKPGPGAAWALVEAIDKLVPEVRRLNAAQRELSLEIVSAFGEYQMAFDERDRLQSELTAVRAAVEEESQRADRAEAAARELRDCLAGLPIADDSPMGEGIVPVLDSTAWLDAITEEGKDNG